MKLSPAMRRYVHIFFSGGPVGLFYVLRLAWLRWRLVQVSTHLQAEKQLHRECLAQLAQEMTSLVDVEQRLNVAAAQFWKALGDAEGTPEKAPS